MPRVRQDCLAFPAHGAPEGWTPPASDTLPTPVRPTPARPGPPPETVRLRHPVRELPAVTPEMLDAPRR